MHKEHVKRDSSGKTYKSLKNRGRDSMEVTPNERASTFIGRLRSMFMPIMENSMSAVLSYLESVTLVFKTPFEISLRFITNILTKV
jgi:hypothetical protein